MAVAQFVAAAAIAAVACGNPDTKDRGDARALMAPGQDCSVCHDFTAAGTVFGVGGVADPDVLVVLGPEQLTTNAAGNFFTRSAIPFPVVPELVRGGVVRRMAQPISIGACNRCHGTGSAPELSMR
jgi:cytochrome c553